MGDSGDVYRRERKASAKCYHRDVFRRIRHLNAPMGRVWDGEDSIQPGVKG